MNHNILITNIHRVVYVGKNEYSERRTDFQATLPHHELIFHFSGRATVYFDDKVLHTQPDNIRFLPKGTYKRYRVERHGFGECIFVCFDSNEPFSEEAFVLKISNNAQIGSLFKKLFAVWVGQEKGYYCESMSILYKIFAELQKENYIPQNQYLTIKPALEYIDEHFLEGKISVQFLAELCGVSISYLKKLFVKKFGITPTKYIIQRKINYACDLLKYEQYTITQTALMCGYDDVYFFSRQFKEYMGISPSGFIKKYKSSK